MTNYLILCEYSETNYKVNISKFSGLNIFKIYYLLKNLKFHTPPHHRAPKP